MTAAGHGQRLGIVAVLLALVALGWVVADIVDRFYTTGVDSGQSHDNSTAIAASPTHEFKVSNIVNAHLFGEAIEPSTEQPETAPETTLRLNLIGLVASTDERYARAIIGVNGRQVKPYAVGQSVEGTDASVSAVEENRVLLKRGNALESLILKRNQVDLQSTRRNDS